MQRISSTAVCGKTILCRELIEKGFTFKAGDILSFQANKHVHGFQLLTSLFQFFFFKKAVRRNYKSFHTAVVVGFSKNGMPIIAHYTGKGFATQRLDWSALKHANFQVQRAPEDIGKQIARQCDLNPGMTAILARTTENHFQDEREKTPALFKNKDDKYPRLCTVRSTLARAKYSTINLIKAIFRFRSNRKKNSVKDIIGKINNGNRRDLAQPQYCSSFIMKALKTAIVIKEKNAIMTVPEINSKLEKGIEEKEKNAIMTVPEINAKLEKNDYVNIVAHTSKVLPATLNALCRANLHFTTISVVANNENFDKKSSRRVSSENNDIEQKKIINSLASAVTNIPKDRESADIIEQQNSVMHLLVHFLLSVNKKFPHAKDMLQAMGYSYNKKGGYAVGTGNYYRNSQFERLLNLKFVKSANKPIHLFFNSYSTNNILHWLHTLSKNRNDKDMLNEMISKLKSLNNDTFAQQFTV